MHCFTFWLTIFQVLIGNVVKSNYIYTYYEKHA